MQSRPFPSLLILNKVISLCRDSSPLSRVRLRVAALLVPGPAAPVLTTHRLLVVNLEAPPGPGNSWRILNTIVNEHMG